MRIELALKLEKDEPESDTAELLVNFRSEGFSGEGSAWVQLSRLKTFAECILQYPLPGGSVPVLAGGFWDTTASHVVQEHIRISVEPRGSLGKIKISVYVAVPDDAEEQDRYMHLKCAASVNILTDYSQLSLLGDALRSFVDGSKDEVSFTFSN